MRNWKHNHPDPEDLVRFCDGELSSKDLERVTRHIESCWECRTEVEDNLRVIGRYVHYRRDILPSRVPPPAKDWGDLKAEFARIRNEHQKPNRWLLFLRARRRLVAACAATGFVVATAIAYLAHTPPIRAAELVERAVLQEGRLPGVADAVVRVQTRAGTFARPARLAERDAGSYLAPGDVDLFNRVELWFRSAHYNWLSPLSARAFSEWRNQLPEKRDAIVTRSEQGLQDVYELQTSTKDGELEAATLVLRKSDLRPLRGEFHFRSGERVDIYETSAESRLRQPSPTPPRAATPEQPNSPTKAEPSLPVAVGPEDELRVLAALHSIGADLGEPVTLGRDNGRVVVSGVGLNEGRQKEIEEALRSVPLVVTEFKRVQRTPVSPQMTETVTEKAGVSELARRIEQAVGGSIGMEALSESLLKITETLLVRAHALRMLADRFPSDIEAKFSAVERSALDNIRFDHQESITAQIDRIDEILSPVLVQLGVVAPVRQESMIEPWQAAARSNLMAAQRFDRIVATTFAPTSGNPADSNELGSALTALRATAASLRVDVKRR